MKLMKRMDRYITINFLKSFFLSVFTFVGIFIISQLFKVIRYITEGRLTEVEGIKYMLYLLPEIIVTMAPLGVLLGGLMTISKMASNLEIIALKTSGISFGRIIKYPVIASFMISLVAYGIYDNIYPKTNLRAMELKRGNQDYELPEVKEDAFLRGEETHVYKAAEIDRIHSSAKNLQVVLLDDKFEKALYIANAKKGIYDRDKGYWILKDVEILDVEKEISTHYDTYEYKALKERPEMFLTPKIKVEYHTVKELFEYLKIIKKTGGDSIEIKMEISKRRAFPFACFVISFLGLSLGSRYVRGANALSIAMSVALGYGYYILEASLEAFAENGIIQPFVAFWAPNLVFLIIGIVVVKKSEF